MSCPLAAESGVCPSLHPRQGRSSEYWALGLFHHMTSPTKTPVPGCTFWIELGSSSWLVVRGSRGDDEFSVLGSEGLLPAQPEGIEGAGPPRSWAGPLRRSRGFPWLGHEGRGLPRADLSPPCGQLCCTSEGRGRIWPFPAEEDDVAWCLFPRSCRGNAAVLRLFVWVLLPGGVRCIARSRQWHQLPMHPRWRE